MIYRKRLLKEKKENDKGFEEFYVNPIDDKLDTWHFTLRGQKGSQFEGGLYHGYFKIPEDYPMSPPDLYFINQSGRYATNKKICLTITGYHKEQWSPAWNFRTMMSAISGYFIIEDTGIGSIKASPAERKKHAKNSHTFSCSKCGSLAQIAESKMKK